MPKPVEDDTIMESVVGTFRDIVEVFDGHHAEAEDKRGVMRAYEDDTHRISGHHPFTTFLLEFKGDEGYEEYDEKVVVVVYTGPDL